MIQVEVKETNDVTPADSQSQSTGYEHILCNTLTVETLDRSTQTVGNKPRGTLYIEFLCRIIFIHTDCAILDFSSYICIIYTSSHSLHITGIN